MRRTIRAITKGPVSKDWPFGYSKERGSERRRCSIWELRDGSFGLLFGECFHASPYDPFLDGRYAPLRLFAPANINHWADQLGFTDRQSAAKVHGAATLLDPFAQVGVAMIPERFIRNTQQRGFGKVKPLPTD